MIATLRIASILLLLVLCLWGRAVAQPSAAANDPHLDSQLWPDTQASIRLRPQWSLTLFTTIRLGQDDSALVSKQAGIGINRAFGEHWSGALSYRYISAEPTPGARSQEHRFFADLTPRLALKWGVRVSDRNRIELRNVSHVGSWRYRNRLQFERPMKVGGFKFTPYVADEPYFYTRYQGWTRNQFFAGARVPLNRHLTFDGFYMRQSDARTLPGYLHVLGAFWRLDF